MHGRGTPDARLTLLIENFPSVKSALNLNVFLNLASAGLPTDPVLDHFKRLRTITMMTLVHDNGPSFWKDLFAIKAYRRVPNFRVWQFGDQFPAVAEGQLFSFITDVSHMPVDTPRVVQFGRFGAGFLNALERRFNKNIDSIGGKVCAIINGHDDQEIRYLTNMAVGSQKEILAEQLLRDS
ncbi:hypothetical protein AAVH_41562 [Aphelenchoides avenae]|nr:hypothetical protein AAVH_41562 [Aphelenchus avenae]